MASTVSSPLVSVSAEVEKVKSPLTEGLNLYQTLFETKLGQLIKAGSPVEVASCRFEMMAVE